MAEFHPLFPPDENDDEDSEPPDIQEVAIQRKENGKYVTAPRSFLLQDLPNVSAIFAEFGGGEYQLIGRDSRHVIRRRVLLQLPGPPKPMFDEGPQPEKKVNTQALDPMQAMMGGQQGGMLGLIMMMMQQMMQSYAEASRQSMQMMMAFMQTMSTGNAAQIQAAQDAMNRQAERDRADKQAQIELITRLTEARGNSSGSEETFFKGVEFMRQFSTQQIEMAKASAKGGGDFDLESILESVAQALQGFSALKEMSGEGGVQVAPAASQVVP